MRVLIIACKKQLVESLGARVKTIWPGSEVVDVPSTAAAIARIRAGAIFDVILLDLYLREGSALTAIRRVRGLPSAPPVVVTAEGGDEATVAACIDAGACGYLLKALSDRAFAAALEIVLSGEVFVPWTLRGRAVEAPKACCHAVKLTRRERQVLRELGEGKSNKCIAIALGISEVTVKLHVRGLLRKLDARNRTHAVRRAIALRLLE